uniref:Ground-like domain-containing protein n=1 Tax=Plectus sambesii TaxID=2011161 RepID=A0A914UQM4_9BILA
MKTVLILAGLLVAIHSANGFGFGMLGGGGGCGTPACPPPAAPVCPVPAAQPCSACPPPPRPCPPRPPPPCPPSQPCPPRPPPPCPPPQPCPPPPPPPCPPPQPCPPPPLPPQCPDPPPSCGDGCGGGGGGGGGGQASNDCCSSCGQACRFRRFRLRGAPTSIRSTDPKCNSEKLRQIMLENMSDNANLSKRSILKAAQEKLKGKYSVICSNGDLSYIVNSGRFCLETSAGSTCYAFRN